MPGAAGPTRVGRARAAAGRAGAPASIADGVGRVGRRERADDGGEAEARPSLLRGFPLLLGDAGGNRGVTAGDLAGAPAAWLLWLDELEGAAKPLHDRYMSGIEPIMDGAAGASGGYAADISALTVGYPCSPRSDGPTPSDGSSTCTAGDGSSVTASKARGTTVAVAKAAAILAEQGLVVCSGQLAACHIDEIHHACRPVEAAVLSQLARRGLSPHYGAASGFRFVECASRCPGRVDMRCNAGAGRGDHGGGGGKSDQLSLQDSWQVSASGGDRTAAPPLWRQVVRDALGSRCKLCYAGLVMNLPGSHDQGWHVDAPALFSSEEDEEEDEGDDDHDRGGGRTRRVQQQLPDLPPHALTVFVPLCTPDPSLGATEFFCGSHRAELRSALEDGRLAMCGHTPHTMPHSQLHLVTRR